MNIVYPVQQELAEKNVVREDRWLKASLNDCISTFRFVFVRITALMPSSFPEYSPYGVGENHGNEVAVFPARIFFIYSCKVSRLHLHFVPEEERLHTVLKKVNRGKHI